MSKKIKEPQVIIPLSEYERLKCGPSELREAFARVLRVVQVDPDLEASDLTVTLARVRDDAERWRSMIRDPDGAPFQNGCTIVSNQFLGGLKADAERWRSFGAGITDQTLTQVNADTRLGALVRKMPQEYNLRHLGTGGWGVERSRMTSLGRGADTPEEALTTFLNDAAALGK